MFLFLSKLIFSIYNVKITQNAITDLEILKIKKYYYISQLIRALWLVILASRTLLYGPLNSKVIFSRHAKCQRYNKYLTNLVFSVRTVSYGSSFFPKKIRKLQYGPRTRLVRGMEGEVLVFRRDLSLLEILVRDFVTQSEKALQVWVQSADVW